MTISIVMTYFNRRFQLLNTLRTINHYGGIDEIIVVDDASTERIDDIPGIKIVRIEPENKKWHCPCVPFNIGFSLAKGDVIIMQNPECLYTGDIAGYVRKNIKPNKVLSFAAYSLDYHLYFEDKDIPLLAEKIMKEPQRTQIEHSGWYNHSKFNIVYLNFCNAIMRKDLEELGGFDERYRYGICYDDNELVIRERRKGMDLKIIDSPFVVHQKHIRTNYPALRKEHAINNKMYYQYTAKETFIKVPYNTHYGKVEVKV